MNNKKKMFAILSAVSLIAITASAMSYADFETGTGFFRAGTLNLDISWEQTRNGTDLGDGDIDGDHDPIFNVTNLQPGETGEATIEFKIEDNPGWVWLRAEQTGNFENNVTTTEYRKTRISCEELYSPNSTYMIVDASECKDYNKTVYWQVDLTNGTRHYPQKGADDNGGYLFAAAVSHRTGNKDTNPSFLDTPPAGLSLTPDNFTVENNTASISFHIEEGRQINLSLASFEMVGPYKHDNHPDMDKQVYYNSHNEVYSAGNHTISVEIPHYEQNSTNKTALVKTYDNTTSEGELGEFLRFELWYDDGDNVKQEDEQLIFNGTAHQFGEYDIGSGLLLDSAPSNGGLQAFEPGDYYIGFKWIMPDKKQCDVQTDAKEFKIEFLTQQARHTLVPNINLAEGFIDTEKSKNNYFEAGEFPECEEKKVCGPIVGLEDGSKYYADRDGESIKYLVERDSESTVKFEALDSTQLGEDGVMETDRFEITIDGYSDSINVKTKAGGFIGNATLSEDNPVVVESSGLFTLELVSINHDGNKTTFIVDVTSDDDEGKRSPALSHIVFAPCEPLPVPTYYQFDVVEGQPLQNLSETTYHDLKALIDTIHFDSRDDYIEHSDPSSYPTCVERDRITLENKTLTVEMDVTEDDCEVTLALYSKPYPDWITSRADEQKLVANTTETLEKGMQMMQLQIP